MKNIKNLVKFFSAFFLLLALFPFSPQYTIAEKEENSIYYVTSNSVNLRAAPSITSPILRVLEKGQVVSAIASNGNWTQITIDDYQSGWVYTQYLSEESNDLQFENSRVDQLLEFAYSYLNCKYRYAGSSPSGFDCSGFTMYVFSKIGFSLPHQAASQCNFGKPIDKSSLQKGDLVFFKTQGSKHINHVGIYIGNGDFIHASSGAGCVRISSLISGYYLSCYQFARRLFI